MVCAETFDPGTLLSDEFPAKDFALSQAARMFLTGADIDSSSALGGPSNPFRQSLWVYRCISVIATNAARVPIRLSRAEAAGTRAMMGLKHVRVGLHRDRKVVRGEKSHLAAREGEIVEGGPLYELLARPNPYQTWNQFLAQTVGLLFAHGRVHWLYDEMVGPRPVTMYPVSGKDTRPLTDKWGRLAKLIGWRFREPNGTTYGVGLDEVLTFQLFDPDDPHGGLAPRDPANLAIVSDYNASLYNAAMFGNSAEPGGAVETDAPFNPELDEQLRTLWHQRHRGAAKAKSLAILWGGLRWKPIASTMQDMQFDAGKRLTRTEICAAYGVPEVVAGFYTDANYQFAEQGRMQFWQDTQMPLLDTIAEGVAVHLCRRFGGDLEAWFDVEDVPIVQQMRNANLEAVDRLWAKGVPLRDLNDLYDLGLPERPWHSVGFLGHGLLPAADVAEGTVFPPVAEGPSSEQTDELDQPTAEQNLTAESAEDVAFQKGKRSAVSAISAVNAVNKAALDRIWRDFARSWNGLARAMRVMLRKRYLMQQRKVITAIKEHFNAEGALAVTSALKQDDQIIARILLHAFEDPKDKERFRARSRVFISDAEELGIRQALSESGLAGDALEAAARRLMRDPRIAQAIQSEAVRISTLIDNATRRILRRNLAAGLEAGEGIRRLTDRVQSVMGNRRAAAQTVARNAVGQTLSAARHRGHVATGMTHKVWVHSRGPGDRRPAHVAAESRYAKGPIPLSSPFIINGAALMYPRDHSAGRPDETVNCQCVSLAKRVKKDLPAGRQAQRHREQKANTTLPLCPSVSQWVSTDDILHDYLARGFYSYEQMLADRTTSEEQDDG